MPTTKLNLENTIDVSIINNYDHKSGYYSHIYNIFDIKNPIPNVGLLGVASGERFALKITKKTWDDISLAVYFDGVPVNQSSVIRSLSNIPESERSNIKNHRCFSCKGSFGENFYLERYNQVSNKNREFVFTNLVNAGINENLISDPSRSNRIEIYFWKEGAGVNISNSPHGLVTKKEMKIGAGKETHKRFSKTPSLINPEYVGKLLFIYVDKQNLDSPYKIPSGLEYNFDDPMDQIPNS